MKDEDADNETVPADQRRKEHSSGDPTRRTRDGRLAEPPSGRTDDGSPFVPAGSGHGRLPRRYADVVVGGQAGSEGKGAVVAHLLRTGDYGAAVRPGSSNAGHTVYGPDGEPYVHQVIPSAATVTEDVNCYMAPESSFGLGEFFEEIQDAADRWGGGNVKERVGVDPKAAVITGHHRKEEADRKLGDDIGSTVHGCGAVRVEKTWRSAGDVRLAEDYYALGGWTVDRTTMEVGEPEYAGHDRVPDALAEHGRRGEAVMVEGTQGTLLSMNQSPHWPFTTSRDATAPAFMSSCGLPPTAARHVWAVFRTYPIRVGGHSGPMDGEEIDFETIADRAGHTEPPVEYTSVTDKKRRVFEWSWQQFEAALRLNDPDLLALTFLDYLDADNHGVRSWWNLTEETREWVHEVHNRAQTYNGSRVALLKTGPRPEHAIDLRIHAPYPSAERWSMGRLPPTDAEDLSLSREGGAKVGGPDDNWFDTHPTPEVNYEGDPYQGCNNVVADSTTNSVLNVDGVLNETGIDADEIVDEMESGGDDD